MSNSVSVVYIDGISGGSSETVRVVQGTTVQQFLSQQGLSSCSDVYVRVNRIPVYETVRSQFEDNCPHISSDHVLQHGDRVTITPRSIRGEWLPKLKDFKRYLRDRGFSFLKNGKGDHEVWADK